MRGMGPEALLVQARVDPRVVLAEYALHDCTREEARAVEELIRRELECLPVRHTAAERLLRWGRKRFRRADLPLAAAPALCREPEGRANHAADAPAARGGALIAAAPAYAGD